MTTSTDIILLLLEQNLVPFLEAEWGFFPKKKKKNWLEVEVHSPFVAFSAGLGRIWELGLLEQT